MIIKFDPKNPITVETMDGKVLFEWNPQNEINLTDKYFTILDELIKKEKEV
jgi:hypothetical protein